MLTQTHFPEYFTKQDIKREPWDIVSKKINAIVEAMTAQEKMAMLYGWPDPEGTGKIANAGYNPGIARLGVPEIRMYDGPTGVTSICETTGLPNPVLLAATWDEGLAYEFGRVAGSENFAVSGNHQLGAQLDIIRTPHFTRNKDMKGEDYYLSSKLGVQEVRGVQDQGVSATLKHFAAANTSSLPGGPSVNNIIDEQTLHETYLRPFEDAVVQAGAGSVMDTYNCINGHYCTDSDYLNNQVLRNMWNFKGLVMSDWGANHNMTLNKGMDMEMPRAAYNDNMRILRGIQDGSLTWDDVNNGVKHVLGSLGVVGLLSLVQLDENGKPLEEFGRTTPIRMQWTYNEQVRCGLLEKNGKAALEIARKGIVLAKNNGALPLSKDECKDGSVALIGLGALHALCGEGQERSFGVLGRMVSPKEHLERLSGGKFAAEKAIDIIGETIPASCLFQNEAATMPGVMRSWGVAKEDTELAPSFMFGPGGGGLEFNGISGELDEYGELVENKIMAAIGVKSEAGPCEGHDIGEIAQVDETIDFTCGSADGKPVKTYRNAPNGTAITNGQRFTWKSFLKAPESGEYHLNLHCIGGQAGFLIQVDGKWIRVGSSSMREGAQWPWESVIPTDEGMGIGGITLNLEAGKVYPIIMYAANLDPNKDLQIRAAWITPSRRKSDYESALAAAKRAKKVVLFLSDFVGAGGGGFPPFGGPKSLELPALQMKLFEDVRKVSEEAGAKLIAVFQAGPAYATGAWADGSDAVVLTYLPGQEGSQALSEILLGLVNPSGKLAQSWPRNDGDTPVSDTPEHLAVRELGITENGAAAIRFSEGIFYGYRWYDKSGVEPGFAFGHGLSYTTFEYSDLSVVPDGDGFTVSVTVTNKGQMTGDEVVQIYIGAAEVPAHIQIGGKQLVGFTRTGDITPGQSKTIKIPIEYKSLCYWDPAMQLQKQPDGTMGKWQVTYGMRKLYVGASSRDIRLEGGITVNIPEKPAAPLVSPL